MAKRNFRSVWKQSATDVINTSLGEWRYTIAKYATKAQLAQAAMTHYRLCLSMSYSQSVKHPRSRKAVEAITENARTLASIGLYLLQGESRV